MKNPYAVGAESLTIEEKLKVLEEMGRPELISVFKECQPRQTRRRKSGAPLDQKVAVSVTSGERAWLEGEIRAIKAAGDSVSMSQYVRDQAMATVDIEQWKLTATSELERLDDIESHRKDLEKKREALIYMTEDTDDEEELALYNRQLYTVKHDLPVIICAWSSSTSAQPVPGTLISVWILVADSTSPSSTWQTTAGVIRQPYTNAPNVPITFKKSKSCEIGSASWKGSCNERQQGSW